MKFKDLMNLILIFFDTHKGTPSDVPQLFHRRTETKPLAHKLGQKNGA